MLLKRFADADDKIVMVSRQTPANTIVTKAATACAEVGFYAIPAHDVEDIHRVGHDAEGVEATSRDPTPIGDGVRQRTEVMLAYHSGALDGSPA